MRGVIFLLLLVLLHGCTSIPSTENITSISTQGRYIAFKTDDTDPGVRVQLEIAITGHRATLSVAGEASFDMSLEFSKGKIVVDGMILYVLDGGSSLRCTRCGEIGFPEIWNKLEVVK